MSRLKKYQTKRKFDKTTEPKPKIAHTKNDGLRFCVQKHKARRLHYDLRLELDGVLLSWAVPKGPSMDPQEKRLAVHVEDHPLDYINFEGEIPAGNYGAGTVEIWDSGVYIADKKEMREGMKKGHLHFILQGKKLFGGFALVKIKGREENAWLLFKIEDTSTPKIKTTSQKTKMPGWINPMLASTVDQPFDSPEWLFETKWDGYRALAFVNGSRVKLWSRNQKSFDARFPAIIDELKKLNIRAILDGEIVALDDTGISRFELLQNSALDHDLNLHYMIFDVLFLHDQDVRSLPLLERKNLLSKLFAETESDVLYLTDFVEEVGKFLFQKAKKHGLEGLIGKRKDSPYVSLRSPDWVKIKALARADFVIGGFTKPRGSRQNFGALLLGEYSKGVLKFVGHVGTGFDTRTLKSIYHSMKPLIQKECPFDIQPQTNNPATWLKPQLMAEISFTEKTKAGILRHPVFHGLAIDKDAHNSNQAEVTSIDPKAPSLSNPNKIFWPEEGYTKGDMLAYYEEIAPYIVPHLFNRPLTLHRFPDGIHGSDFYQKNIEHEPSWLKTELLTHTRGTGKKHDRYPLINNTQSLLYIANLASIEMHPMLARSGHLDCPDFLVLDLDPEGLPLSSVVEVAKTAHKLCDKIGLPNYCKTSGGRGLHIYLPLGGTIPFEHSLRLAELLAYLIQDQMPSLVSLVRSPEHRQKRVYIDYLQNAKGKSTIAPYSLRAQPKAPVSTPLAWREVTKSLDPLAFTIVTIPKRLEKIGDIFQPVLHESIDLKDVLKRLEQRLHK